MRKIILFVAVLAVMLVGCTNAQEKKNIIGTETVSEIAKETAIENVNENENDIAQETTKEIANEITNENANEITNETTNENKIDTEKETSSSQMPASYQDQLTNILGAVVRVRYGSDWTDPISNGRAIAERSKGVNGISIDIKNNGKANNDAANNVTENNVIEGNIVYKAHEVSGVWLGEEKNGKEVLLDNSSINAVSVKLAGQCADTYDVYTKIYQNNKWSQWALNGNTVGDENGTAITGICVEIRKKTEGVPAFNVRDVDPNSKMIALTFDDSPSDKETDNLLDILEKNDACATFFVIGQEVNEDRTDTMKRIVAAGSELGIHTFGHDNLTQISKEQIASTCAECSWRIEKATNYRPVVMRAPGGNCNEEALDVLKKLDLPNVLWSVDSHDWKKKSSEQIADRILKDVTEGSIILAHDTKKSTVEAMKIVVPELVKRGYQFMTVSELFAYNGGICAGKQYSGIGGADEPSSGEDEFNDITIYNDGNVKVDFCGVDFDDSDKSITLNICCDNSTDEKRKFKIGNIRVNGENYESDGLLGSLDESSSEVFEFLITNAAGIDYDKINSIRFLVEIDDADNNELAKSQPVNIQLDTQEETFSATLG